MPKYRRRTDATFDAWQMPSCDKNQLSILVDSMPDWVMNNNLFYSVQFDEELMKWILLFDGRVACPGSYIVLECTDINVVDRYNFEQEYERAE